MLQKLECTSEEIDTLADAVEKTIQTTLEIKHKLYTRIPPSVPRTLSRSLVGCVTFTDISYAKHLSGTDDGDVKLERLQHRIRTNRVRLGLPPVFSEEQGKRVSSRILKTDQKLEQQKQLKTDFFENVSHILSIEPEKLKRYERSLGLRDFPNPSEFGEFLSEQKMTEKKRETLVTFWLEKFRNSLTGQDLANEIGISKERIRQIKNKLGYKHRTMDWSIAEKIREYFSKRQRANKDQESPIMGS